MSKKVNILEKYEEYLYINYSQNTKYTYLNELNLFIKWWEETNGEDFDPIKATILDIKEFEQYLSNAEINTKTKGTKKKITASTVNKKLEVIKSFFKWCEEKKFITENPTLFLKNRKIPKRDVTVRWLDRNEKNKLIRIVNDLSYWKSERMLKRNRAIVYLMLFVGLRVSEVSNLRKDDIDYTRQVIWVEKGKGNKTRRVEVSKDLLKIIGEWIEIDTRVDSDYLITSQLSDKISEQGIEHLFRYIKKIMENEEITPHTLRHTFCHDLAEKGYSLSLIADLVGHESVLTTRVYTTSSREERRKAVESLF